MIGFGMFFVYVFIVDFNPMCEHQWGQKWYVKTKSAFIIYSSTIDQKLMAHP